MSRGALRERTTIREEIRRLRAAETFLGGASPLPFWTLRIAVAAALAAAMGWTPAGILASAALALLGVVAATFVLSGATAAAPAIPPPAVALRYPSARSWTAARWLDAMPWTLLSAAFVAVSVLLLGRRWGIATETAAGFAWLFAVAPFALSAHTAWARLHPLRPRAGAVSVALDFAAVAAACALHVAWTRDREHPWVAGILGLLAASIAGTFVIRAVRTRRDPGAWLGPALARTGVWLAFVAPLATVLAAVHGVVFRVGGRTPGPAHWDSVAPAAGVLAAVAALFAVASIRAAGRAEVCAEADEGSWERSHARPVPTGEVEVACLVESRHAGSRPGLEEAALRLWTAQANSRLPGSLCALLAAFVFLAMGACSAMLNRPPFDGVGPLIIVLGVFAHVLPSVPLDARSWLLGVDLAGAARANLLLRTVLYGLPFIAGCAIVHPLFAKEIDGAHFLATATGTACWVLLPSLLLARDDARLRLFANAAGLAPFVALGAWHLAFAGLTATVVAVTLGAAAVTWYALFTIAAREERLAERILGRSDA